MTRPPAQRVVVSSEAAEVLRALLGLDPDEVREVRERARRRNRPRPQLGPTAEY